MTKKPNSVGYFSAYYRGLECLLKLWPAIRKEVPDATLDIFYGWESWLAIQGEDALYERICAKLESLKDQGVTEHGRVGHKELIKRMQETQVWAYPTEFPEIHCITALKAQEAKCFPVTTTQAALDETVQSGVKIPTKRMYFDEYSQKKFVKEVVQALKFKKVGQPVPDCGWDTVARKWEEAIA
jgi:glycosyltransferase involved in cell wall biosynthesis